MVGREVREYTNLTDPKDKKWGKWKDKIDDDDVTFQRMVAKRNPTERPTMHEVARVLDSLLPVHHSKKPLSKGIDYAKFAVDKEKQQQQQPKVQQPKPVHRENHSSEAQWFLRFGEVISKNTL